MAYLNEPARDSARWTGDDQVRLDHATLAESDLDWLAGVRSATLWNVKFPEGFLARLPMLEILDMRGGTGKDADFVVGCDRLRLLSINQIRGLADLSALGGAVGLEYLKLYGLPRVSRFPSLGALELLEGADLGSMKGLQDISGLLQAPALSELVFVRNVAVTLTDAVAIADHRSLQKFSWFAEDVPNRVWVPFVDRVAKPPAPLDGWVRRARA